MKKIRPYMRRVVGLLGLLFLVVVESRLSVQAPRFPQALRDQSASSLQRVPGDASPAWVQGSLWEDLNPLNLAKWSAERLHEFLRDQLVGYLNSSFRGEVSVGRTEGSVIGGLTIYDLTLRYQGTDVLQVPRLAVSYKVVSLVRGAVEVSRVDIFEPVMRLVQDAGGNWNVTEAFSPQTEQPQEEPATEEGGLEILLDTVLLRGAHVDVTLSGEEAQTYQLTETNLNAHIEILPAGLDVQVRDLASRISAEDLPPLQAEAVLAYQGTASPATVKISALKLDTQHSRIWVAGEIHDLNTMDTEAELLIENLARVDASQVVPTWPLKEDLSGKLQVTGPLADLHGTLALVAADARVAADLQADLSQELPRYGGTVTISRFDAQKLLEGQELAGIVEGTVQVQGVGTSLATINGEADLQVQALQVASWQVGDVALNGSLKEEKGKLSGKVDGSLGQAKWEGEIDLAEEQPGYELAVSMENLDIKKVAAGEEPLSSDLNLKGTVKGKGFDFPKMHAHTEVEVLPSTVGPVQVKHGRLAAELAKGRVQISEATLTATDATLAVHGELGTTAQETGQLSYTLQVGDVSPWLSLVDQKGSGALSLSGEAKGSLADLQVQGELKADRLRVEESAIQSGIVTFNLKDLGQTYPSGALTARLNDVRAGVELQTAEAQVTLPQVQQESAPLVAQVEVKARENSRRAHHLSGEVSYQPEQITARLKELALELPDGRWRLSQPTQIVQDKEEITIERLRLVNRDQQVLVDGKVSFTGKQDLRVQIEQFALATLQPLLPQQPEVAGNLSAQVQVNGTAASPRIEGAANLTSLQVAGQDYNELSTTVGYKDRQASLDLTFQQDATHALNATGTIPLAVSWAEGWKAEVLGDMDLRARSSGLSLAFLNAFSGEAIEGVAGELGLDVTLAGPVSHPIPRGTFQLREGQAAVNPLGVEISAITVEGEVDPEQVRIAQIAARAGEGQINGNGTIALQGYAPESVTISLSADRWPAIQTRQYQAQISGQVRTEGPLTAPKVQGQLRVPEATLRPDLELLADQPVKRDETIIIRQAKGTAESAVPPETKEEGEQEVPQDDTFQNLAVDLTVLLPRNTWIKHENADIELEGDVHVVKKAGGEDLVLVGTIEVVRGWVGFKGRRFTLAQGEIVFSGDKDINPELHIVAQYRSPQYEIEVIIGGTAQEPTLTLQSDPELEQADILAVLLFGKPASALGEGEQKDLQQQALDITSGYAASKIGESVSQALGLENLGIELRDVDFTGGRVGFGRYLSPNTYVSVSQGVGGKEGREASVDYYLSPEWKVTTSTTAEGNNQAGITWHKQY